MLGKDVVFMCLCYEIAVLLFKCVCPMPVTATVFVLIFSVSLYQITFAKVFVNSYVRNISLMTTYVLAVINMAHSLV